MREHVIYKQSVVCTDWVESASELFYRLLVSTHWKSNRRGTDSHKFLLVLLSKMFWSQLNCLQNKGFYLKLTMSGLVSVQNTVDTGHEDMIVSWYHQFSLFTDIKRSNVAISLTVVRELVMTSWHTTVKEFMWQLKGLFKDTLDRVFSLYWFSDGHALSPPSQHDAQMDYYGRRLATCSSDRTVKIFEIVNNAQNLVATLVG